MPSAAKKYLHQHKDTAAPHTGRMVRLHINGICINHADLGRSTGRSTSTVRALLDKHSMQSAILWELCQALKHNFFADLAAQLPADYKSDAQSQLAAENAELRVQVVLMKELLGKGK